MSIYIYIIYISVYLYSFLSIYLSTYLSIYFPIYLSIYLSIYLYKYVCTYNIYIYIISIYLSIFIYIYRYISVHIYLNICTYIYIYLYKCIYIYIVAAFFLEWRRDHCHKLELSWASASDIPQNFGFCLLNIELHATLLGVVAHCHRNRRNLTPILWSMPTWPRSSHCPVACKSEDPHNVLNWRQ